MLVVVGLQNDPQNKKIKIDFRALEIIRCLCFSGISIFRKQLYQGESIIFAPTLVDLGALRTPYSQ